jgi:GT2 family glycosyltransferase
MNLSIVIPSYNRPDLLQACLSSVQRHAPTESEVIVVDDASPGGVIRETASAFAGVRVLRQPRRRGFCAAVNVGIRAARGEFVELLNDDTEVTAGWASNALAAFDDRSVAAVAPLVLFKPAQPEDTPRIDSAGDRYYLGGIAGKRGHGEPLTPAYLQRRLVFGASGSSAFYRRNALLQVGAFPEEFGAYFEDVDLAFRLHRAGYRVMVEPRSLVFHRGSASHGTTGRRLMEQLSLNEERVFWRNLPGRELLRALPLHLLVLAGKARRRWHEGTLVPFLCGRLRLLRELPALIRHRRWLLGLGPEVRPHHWHVESHFWGG